MENKITTKEEYDNVLKEKKKYRNIMFDIKLDLFKNKNDIEKIKLLQEKETITKSKYKDITFKIKQYELEEQKKIGGKIK